MSVADALQPQATPGSPPSSLEGEMVALIARNAARSQNFMIAGAALVAAILMLDLGWVYPGAWWAVLSVAALVRTRFLVKLPAYTVWTDAAKLRVTGMTFAAMALVQSALMLFFPFVPLGIGAVLTMYLVGMCAGMVASVTGLRRIIWTYTLIVMGAIALAWTLTPDPTRDALDRVLFVLMCLMFAKVLIDYADNAQRLIEQSHRIRMERYELNMQLAQALGQADAANRAKTRFLASASHDLRQPIHALSLFSGSLLMRALDARSAAIAVQLDKSIKTLAAQLDALLDVSRLDAGVVDKSIQTLDLDAMFAQLREEFAALAAQKGLALRIEEGQGVCLRTDPMLLLRILRNLVSNAIKYTAEGQVEVRVESLDHATRCRVTVEDSGPGIPQSEHEHIFEEFYQLENQERDRTQGMGLGLAIVRRLAGLLDIVLRLDSQPGRGTRFHLELPQFVEPGARARPGLGLAQWPDAGPGPAPPSRGRVLVVDDEEAVRIGMKALLEEMGFQVDLAGSTEAAIDISRRFAPSLVLADLRLRGSDSGIHTIQALRVVWPELPALLISGDTAPDRLREARDAGFTMLHKPVSAEQLRETITRTVPA